MLQGGNMENSWIALSYLHTEQFPLREMQKLAEWDLPARQMRKYTHGNRQERLR